MIEISHFQTLVAVAHSGNFSKAANDLSVTQSAISQSIKSLESKVGAKLFRRQGRKAKLTQEGEKIYELANEFLDKIADTLQEIQEDRGEMKGRIRVGTLVGLGKSLVAPKLIDFAVKFPRVNFDLQMSYASQIMRDFEQGNLDCLVVPEGDLPASGERTLIGLESIQLVFPKSDQFPLTSQITLQEIEKYPLVMFEDTAPLFFSWCRSRFGRVPSKIKKRFVVNSHGNIMYAVSKGLGIAVLPTHVLERSHLKERVKTLGTQALVSNGSLYFVYQPEHQETMRIQSLIDEFLRDFMGPAVLQ